jgi:signal transduction histidine kinase
MAEGGGADQGRAPLRPALHLDELLHQLQDHVGALVDVRDRMYKLLDAVVSVGSQLELSEVLERIVRAATDLVDARYGALGVLDEQGTGLAEFVYHGIDEETADRIGQLLTQTPADGFVGVPVYARGQVFGNLYLTEKRSGEEFDETDTSILEALATAAGIAIENARLYETTQLGERWREASSEVASSLLSGADSTEVLELIAERARTLADAMQAIILLPSDDIQGLRVAAAAGPDSDRLRGVVVAMEDGRAGAVYASGVPEAYDMPDQPPVKRLADIAEIGPRLVVPLGRTGQTRGVLLIYKRGRQPFRPVLLSTLTAFAEQAAVAIDLSEHRRDAERMAVYEDRDRIARNLHDLVIQRLFATGMGIEAAVRLFNVDSPTAITRLTRAVDDIDGTIREIRTTVFALQTPEAQRAGLSRDVLDVVSELAPVLGFEPSARFVGLVDTAVPDSIADHVLAVAREALTNVAKHAHAHSATVSVTVDEDVELEIRDDGVGMPETNRHSGLANMAERARELGGTCTVAAADPGTTVRWRVPINPADKRA